MYHPIDPMIDCVFKALLGAEDNLPLLVHFLNAVLGADLPQPIVQVEILNPFNEREFLDDKLSVVDIKARDATGRLYQIEIQLLTYPDLPARILYTWSDLYTQQLKSGEPYGQLRPTFSVWLLAADLLPTATGYAHRYRFRDGEGRGFIDHGEIVLFELNRFAAAEVNTEEERWLKFFTEGERLDPERLPDWMQTTEMRRAMSTLQAFSEQERAYDAYRARQHALHLQASIQQRQLELETAYAAQGAELEAERQAKEAAIRAKEAERQAKEAALAEIARLKTLLQTEQRPPADSR
jgi:predicted transposase/invertase (TIGR01784 family)